MKIIDLRSDTVTKPSAEMRKIMFEAEVGDDVYGEDPTVNKLEKLASEMLGTEDAIFAPSGTQTNLMALLSHCERGEEYIVGQGAHTYIHEGGGAAVLGSIQPQPIEFEESARTLGIKRIKPVSRITNPRKTIPMAKKGNETISNVRKLMELIELIIPKPTTISIEPNSVE